MTHSLLPIFFLLVILKQKGKNSFYKLNERVSTSYIELLSKLHYKMWRINAILLRFQNMTEFTVSRIRSNAFQIYWESKIVYSKCQSICLLCDKYLHVPTLLQPTLNVRPRITTWASMRERWPGEGKNTPWTMRRFCCEVASSATRSGALDWSSLLGRTPSWWWTVAKQFSSAHTSTGLWI